MKSLQSDLKKAKNLGSAKGGSSNWWMERLTSIMLIPLSIWFVIVTLQICLVDSNCNLKILLDSAFNVIMMIMFLSVSLYHGHLGLKVIIEDYVHSEGYKFFMIITSQIITYATIIFAIAALISYHFASIA